MSRVISKTDLDKVLAAIASHPGGVSIGDLAPQIPGVPRRSLQRWLAALVEAGEVEIRGMARARRYVLASAERASTPPLAAAGLVLSSPGEEIARAVGADRASRMPVGYRRAFLDDYRPNETFYLPGGLRRRLLEIGQTPDGKRPAGTFARQLLGRLLVDLSWNSSRLEGNTYSLLETERLIERGSEAEGKDTREAQMILNHKAAIEFMVESAQDLRFDRMTILNLHALLSDNLLPDPAASGRLRAIQVQIHGTVFEPLGVPQLVEECFRQVLSAADAIRDPFEQAFFALVHIPYLQPFEDVNKRVSRLAANIPFIRDNLCPLSFIDVPEEPYVAGILGVYELNRVELLRDVFAWAYQRSCARYAAIHQSLGEPDPFKLRYRSLIQQAVAEVVRGGLDKEHATPQLREFARGQVEEQDRARFLAAVEAELVSLHEGNFARFRLRPSEFAKWSATWR